MKKILMILLSIILIFNFVSAEQEKEIKVTIDGQEVFFPDQKPVIQNQRILVPVRFISEALGAAVDWIQEEKKSKLKRMESSSS